MYLFKHYPFFVHASNQIIAGWITSPARLPWPMVWHGVCHHWSMVWPLVWLMADGVIPCSNLLILLAIQLADLSHLFLCSKLNHCRVVRTLFSPPTSAAALSLLFLYSFFTLYSLLFTLYSFFTLSFLFLYSFFTLSFLLLASTLFSPNLCCCTFFTAGML